jgi:hypothetical protein
MNRPEPRTPPMAIMLNMEMADRIVEKRCGRVERTGDSQTSAYRVPPLILDEPHMPRFEASGNVLNPLSRLDVS